MYKIYTNKPGITYELYHKIWLVMRLTTVILIASLIQVSAATFGQRITLNKQNVPLKTVLKEIREQSGYNFFYDGDILNNNVKTSLNVQNATLEQAIQKALDGLSLTYEIDNKIVLIKKKEPSFLERLAERWAAIDVTGRIVDGRNTPIPGATIKVKGTKQATATNQNGVFTLSGVAEGAVLVISFTGYESKEITATTNLGNVVLELSDNPLDEVQVIAYGTTTRRLSTGNIGTVKAKDIENQPVTNPLLALQGRVPGLVITQQTGVPGGGVIVRIQGQNSMNSGNAPLFVVDGVPIESYLYSIVNNLLGSSGTENSQNVQPSEGNPLSYLNPADIESIDVLKDADATAIYGSRAANGAILITTKKGKIGKMQLEANVNTGWGKANYNRFKMLNTRQYLDMRYEAYRNDGIDWRAANVNAPDLKLWDTTRYTNWHKELLNGTALSQQARIAVTGGNNSIQFRLAGTYNRTSSLFPDNGNGNPIGSVSSSINSVSANNRLRMSWTFNYQYNHQELPGGFSISEALLLAPNAPNPFNADGTINWAPNASGSSTFLTNPYIGISNVNKSTTTNLVTNLNLGYKILSGLELGTSLGYTNIFTDSFIPVTTSSIRPEYRPSFQNQAIYGNRNNRSWIAEPKLTYNVISPIGKFDILLGGTLNERNGKAQSLLGINYPSDELLENIGSAGSLSVTNTNQTQYRYLAFFGRVNYNLNDGLILNFSTRRDGSSRFGDNRKFSNFWSMGGTWVFTNLMDIQNNLKWLSFGKLRISYGITGNDQIGDFNYLQLYKFGGGTQVLPYQGIPSLGPDGVPPNPELVWERNRKFSTGLDLGFAKDKVIFVINYNENNSGNQLLAYDLSSVTGAFAMYRNLDALVRNTTWEFSLNSVNIKAKQFEWSTNFNVSIARNKLVKYPGLAQSSYASTYVIGEPIDIRQLIRFAGLNTATGEYQYFDKSGNPTSSPALGDNIYRSLTTPFYGGVQNNFRWKNFSFNFHIQFTKQWGDNVYYGQGNTIIPGRYIAGTGSNQPITVLGRWRQVGDQSNIAKFTTLSSNPIYNIAFSDVRITDASYVRLEHASLAWAVPDKWMKSVGLQSASLITSGQNLWTLTKYKGPDPETQSLNALPPLRVFTLGCQVVF